MSIDAKRIETEANEIASILDGIHNDPLGNAHEFVERLEGKESLEKALGISDMYTINYGANQRKYNKFCLAYLIKIFVNFTSCKDDMEILLVSYKCIDWGNSYNDTVPENWENYWEHAHKYNKWLMGKKRNDKAHLGREAENKITKALSKVLASIKLNSADSKLGYIDEVLKDFENIPEKLTLPIPEWLKSNGKDTKEDSGKISGTFRFPNGGELSLSASRSKETIEMFRDIAKMMVTATPMIALIVFLGMLGKQIHDHSIDVQKINDFTTNAPLKEETTNNRKIKLEGKDVEFAPLEDDIYGISED